jgi:hypothetical protein
MLLELRRVSRKTPADGKLELAPATAERIRAMSSDPVLVVNGARGRATVSDLECTCGTVPDQHTHYFLESTLLRTLIPESEVAIDLLTDATTVVVANRPVSAGPRVRR